MACNMTGGSSGGPWFSTAYESVRRTTTQVTTLSSLNSYGYSGISNMYGPKFNANTQAVFNAADAVHHARGSWSSRSLEYDRRPRRPARIASDRRGRFDFIVIARRCTPSTER